MLQQLRPDYVVQRDSDLLYSCCCACICSGVRPIGGIGGWNPQTLRQQNRLSHRNARHRLDYRDRGRPVLLMLIYYLRDLLSFAEHLGPTSDAELRDRWIVIHCENKGSVGRGFVLQVQSDDIDVNGNLDLRW